MKWVKHFRKYRSGYFHATSTEHMKRMKLSNLVGRYSREQAQAVMNQCSCEGLIDPWLNDPSVREITQQP